MVGTTRGDARRTLEVLVDELADELGRSVVVDDPAVHVLCTSRHFGDADEVRIRAVLQRDAGAEVGAYVLAQGVARWSGPGVIPGNPALGMHARFCVPLRDRGELLGLLMVMDADGALTAEETTRIADVSRTVTSLLRRQYSDEDAERSAAETAVRALLGADDAARRDAAGVVDDAPAQVVVVEIADRPGRAAEARTAQREWALRSVVDSAVRRSPGRAAAAVESDRAVLLLSGAQLVEAAGRAEAERMVDALARLLPEGAAVVAGVGDVVPGPTQARVSHGRAVAAARGARSLPGRGPVLAWSALGAHGILLQLGAAALDPALIPEPVARLRADDRADRLVATLRAYLDAGGSAPRTATALHLHRTSLYYRLDQIREITGLDLDDGGDRLLLHLGLLLTDLRPESP